MLGCKFCGNLVQTGLLDDEAGNKYAKKAEKKLLEIGVASLVKLKIPQGRPKGWDAADGVLERMNVEEFILNNKSPRNSTTIG